MLVLNLISCFMYVSSLKHVNTNDTLHPDQKSFSTQESRFSPMCYSQWELYFIAKLVHLFFRYLR